MDPSLKTVKALFARSGNRCAFESCDIPIVEETGTVTGVLCHITARSKRGPRYDAQQTDEERHAAPNLMLMCSRHSKLIDSEPERFTVAELRRMKHLHESSGLIEITPRDALKADLLLKSYRSLHISAGGSVMLDSPGAVQAGTVVIKTRKKTIKVLPPAGSLGADLSRLKYAKHLVEQYQKFARQQPGRLFRDAAIYANIKKRFGSTLNLVRLDQFDDLVTFLQDHLDKTMRGQVNRSKGIHNYSTFEEYREKYEGLGKMPKR